MAKGLVIVGAGGLGREVLDIIEAIEGTGRNLGFIGFLDDGEVDRERLTRRGVHLVGKTLDFPRFADRYVIGIGSSSTRERLAAIVDSLGGKAETLIHPTATIGKDSQLGGGCVLAAGARVTTNVRLGRHVHINLNSTIGHDTTIGDFTSVSPCATISGAVVVHSGVTIGTGANVINGVEIGSGSIVGAGSAVVRNVRPHTTVTGVPAKELQK